MGIGIGGKKQYLNYFGMQKWLHPDKIITITVEVRK